MLPHWPLCLQIAPWTTPRPSASAAAWSPTRTFLASATSRYAGGTCGRWTGQRRNLLAARASPPTRAQDKGLTTQKLGSFFEVFDGVISVNLAHNLIGGWHRGAAAAATPFAPLSLTLPASSAAPAPPQAK